MKKPMSIFLSLAFLTILFGSNAWAVHPCIDLVKEVSVDGGLSWHDANAPDSAPETGIGQAVEYRLIVTNCANYEDLVNVTINDHTLGIDNFHVGDLAAGDTIILDSGIIPALNQPGQCAEPGYSQNIATVDGSHSDIVVSDDDPAWVECIDEPVPCVDIEKQISVDGGTIWEDADTQEEAAETEVGLGVMYQLIVSNCGNVDLENVTINDPEIGIVDYLIGDLVADASIILDSGMIPELDQPGRCEEPGTFENIASVEGVTPNLGTKITDSDPAWVYCLERGDEGCTPGYWKQPQHLDSWVDFAPANGFYDVFDREITIRWKAKKGKPRPIANPTLLQALQAKGGGINALARHAVAALLNVSNPEVSYAYTADEVILWTQDAIDDESYDPTKDLFEEANEAGCPLN